MCAGREGLCCSVCCPINAHVVPSCLLLRWSRSLNACAQYQQRLGLQSYRWMLTLNRCRTDGAKICLRTIQTNLDVLLWVIWTRAKRLIWGVWAAWFDDGADNQVLSRCPSGQKAAFLDVGGQVLRTWLSLEGGGLGF